MIIVWSWKAGFFVSVFFFLKYQNRKGTGYDKGQDSADKDACTAQDNL